MTTRAPNARSPATFSCDILSGITNTQAYPRNAATSARPMPVLPLVASTMVPPGPSRPRRSASSTMLRATRSFIEPPGFRYSHLTKISAGTWRASLWSLTIGVCPIASRMLLLAPVMSAPGRVRSGLEVILAVRRSEVIDDALLEQLLHRLPAVAGGDAIVVLVRDDGDVADRRVELLG